MSKYQADIDIVLKARGVNSVKSDLDDTAEAAKRAADKIRNIWKNAKDQLKSFHKDLYNNPFDQIPDPVSEIFDQTPMKASIALGSIRQVNDALAELGAGVQSLDQIMKNPVKLNMQGKLSFLESDDVKELLDQSSDKSITSLFHQISGALDDLNTRGIHNPMDEQILDNLTNYRDLLKQTSVVQNETAGIGGTKVMQFLGRYKYSLLLIGGALGAIVGVMKYSTTFGTAIDVLGYALGYLADVIMYPLLDGVMLLAEFIIGLADWFNALPDPIKTAASALLAFAFAYELLKLLSKTALFQALMDQFLGLYNWMKKFLVTWNGIMAAGGLAGALAWAAAIGTGLLLGFSAVYAMIQIGFTNLLATLGQGARRISPGLTGIFSMLMTPMGMLGTIIVDLLTGQLDQIPTHIQIVAAQGAAGFWTFVSSVQKALNIVQKSINDFLTTTGNVLKLNPLTAGMGNAFLEQAKISRKALDENSNYIDEQLKKNTDRQKALGLAGQYGGFIGYDNQVMLPFGRSKDDKTGKTSSFFVPYESGMEVPEDQYKFMKTGSFLNGLTAADQIKAQMEALKESLGDGSDYEKLLEKYGNASDTSDLTDYTKVLDNQGKAMADLAKQYSDGTISIDEYQKKTSDLIKNLDSATAATDKLKQSSASTNEVFNTVDSGKNAVKAVSGGFKSEDEGTGTYTGHHFTVARDMADRQAKILEAYAKKSKYQYDTYRETAASRLSEVTAAQNALKSLEEQYKSSYENQTKSQTPAMALSSYQDQIDKYYKQLTGKSKEILPSPVKNAYEMVDTKKQTLETVNKVNYDIQSPDVASTTSKIKNWWNQVTPGLNLTVPVDTSMNGPSSSNPVMYDVDLSGVSALEKTSQKGIFDSLKELIFPGVSSNKKVYDALQNLSSDKLIGPNVTDKQFSVSDLNPLTKYFAKAQGAYNPVLDQVQLPDNADIQTAYHELLHATTNKSILSKLGNIQKNDLYDQIMGMDKSAWPERDYYQGRGLNRDQMLDEWLADRGSRYMVGQRPYNTEDYNEIGTGPNSDLIINAMKENSRSMSMYMSLLEGIKTSIPTTSLPSSPATTGTASAQTTKVEVHQENRFEINGANMNLEQLARKVADMVKKEIPRDWDLKTRGSRI